MADGKSARGARPFKPPSAVAREALIDEALGPVLLPELTRFVREYQRRPGHRFDAKTAPEHVTVAADGRSFVVAPSALPWPSIAVWSRDKLGTGASRWTVRLEADQPV
jgi:hypothetical protein